MLEALVFVHKKRVIHRDLKPSNIFMTTNLNITIGDFGVSTVMGDARTRTRTTVGKNLFNVTCSSQNSKVLSLHLT